MLLRLYKVSSWHMCLTYSSASILQIWRKITKSQFLHVESYSFSKSTSKSNLNQNINSIIAEARRDKGAYDHVENPKIPKILYGEDFNIYESNLHEKLSKSTDSLNRKVNKRTHIMLAGVASYPFQVENIKSQDEINKFEKWVKLTNKFLKNEFGGNLDFIVFHQDEKFPHLHFYASPIQGPDFNLNEIHPGKKSQSNLKFTKKNGRERKKLYNQGLKDFQDRYYSEVSLKCGHNRFYKKKGRLSRKEWLEEKTLRETYLKKTSEAQQQYNNNIIQLKQQHKSKINQLEQDHAKLNEELEQSYLNKAIKLEKSYTEQRNELEQSYENKLNSEINKVKTNYDQKVLTIKNSNDELISINIQLKHEIEIGANNFDKLKQDYEKIKKYTSQLKQSNDSLFERNNRGLKRSW